MKKVENYEVWRIKEILMKESILWKCEWKFHFHTNSIQKIFLLKIDENISVQTFLFVIWCKSAFLTDSVENLKYDEKRFSVQTYVKRNYI